MIVWIDALLFGVWVGSTCGAVLFAWLASEKTGFNLDDEVRAATRTAILCILLSFGSSCLIIYRIYDLVEERCPLYLVPDSIRPSIIQPLWKGNDGSLLTA